MERSEREVYPTIKKIFKYVYIHPSILFIFAAAFFTDNLIRIFTLYGIVMIHEMFHLMTAHILKVKVEGISIMPFGITMRLKDDYIRRPEYEIIIAFAGPFSNLLMIFIALIVKAYCLWDTDNMTFFIFSNTAIGLINLIPALPLDGGRILKAVLTLHWGFARTFTIMEKVTKIMIGLLGGWGIYILYMTGFNFSVLLISCFLIFNLTGERRRNHLVMMKEIVYCKQKLLETGICTAKTLVVLHHIPARRLLRYLSYHHFLVITVMNDTMSVMGILTEVEMIEGLIRYGYEVKMGEMVEERWVR